MNKDKTIKLKDWNSDCSRLEETGECLGTHQVAKSLTSENFAALLDEYLNLGGKDLYEGKEIGLQLRYTHRTLQRLAICFVFGIIVGLSEQEYTDARNETAIQTAQKVAEMLEAGKFPLGLYI